MNIPKGLVELAEQVQKKKEETALADVAACLLAEAKRIVEMANRRKRGLKYAQKIFDWAREFRRMTEGKKIIEIGVKYDHRKGIYFFTEKAPGRGSRALGVSKKGLWWIQFGCMAMENYVETPEELALQIDSEILKLACETLDDGRVWKCIEEHMQRRLSE